MAIMRYLRIGNNRYEIADEKLKVSEISSGITYYPIIGTGESGSSSTRQWDSTGFQYDGIEGEDGGEGGNATISLGNYIPIGEVGNKRGSLVLYGEEGSYSVLQSGATGEGTGYYILLPDKQGVVALTDDIPTHTSQLINNSGFLTSYTETDPTVPTWAKAPTKPVYTATEVGAISSVTVTKSLIEGVKSATIMVDGTSYDIYSKPGTITGVKTTAGAHTATDVSDGVVSFNVPTIAAHVGIKFGYTTSGNNRAVLQDSSGNLYVTQKDDNTNTTYTLSGALSSHKFTSTLTAGGSGSGTSISELTLAAGSNITLTDDATNKKITITATDTTYSSKAAASGGTDVSLVTTGEKYTWNSKTSNTGTVTSVAASGSGGITISGSPITTSGTITVGLNLSTAINGLSEGSSSATINDYAVVQYAGGGTTTTTYHRRKLSNLIVGKAVSDQNGLRIDTGYLKLTGGTMTGALTLPQLNIPGASNRIFSFKLSNNDTNVDIGWDWTNADGAGAAFRSADPSRTDCGQFVFFARAKNTNDEPVYTQLVGTPGATNNAGILTWGGRRVVTSTNSSAVGSVNQPVYVDANGHLQVGKSFTEYLPLTGGNVTGPTTFGDTVSIDDLNAGQLVVSGSASVVNDLTVGGLINKFKINVGTGIDANNVRTTNGMWISAAAITNAPTTGHSVLLGFANIGTPFQLNIPDSNHQYIYKRRWNGSSWDAWFKLYAGYADSAGSATSLTNTFTVGSGTTDHGTAIKNWFDASKASIKRNVAIANYSSSSGNGSIYIGYFFNGYDTNPYGGFYVAHYNNPYYVGIFNGTYTQQAILTNTNYTSYVASLRDKSNGTATTLNYGASGMTTTNWFAAWDGYNLKAINPANTLSTIGALPLSGGTMTGKLIMTKAIAYQGTKALCDMIKFKDNTGDEYGNGIVIGGGGLVVIGGGESADAVAATYSSGGSESLDLTSDGVINIWTNVQNGAASAHKETIDANGLYSGTAANANKVNGHTVNADVPSNAKFTDTTGLVGTAQGGMPQSDVAISANSSKTVPFYAANWKGKNWFFVEQTPNINGLVIQSINAYSKGYAQGIIEVTYRNVTSSSITVKTSHSLYAVCGNYA